jgi:hypothetical protein
MRKVFLLTLMIGLVVVATQTQSQKFNGGILVGGLVSQVDGDDWAGYHKLGFLGGGFVSLDVSKHFTLQMEMEYIQKGKNRLIWKTPMIFPTSSDCIIWRFPCWSNIPF